MELYRDLRPIMVYAWQWNVHLEELIHGLAWPEVARAESIAHKNSLVMDMMNDMNIQYPNSTPGGPLFVGIEEQRAKP